MSSLIPAHGGYCLLKTFQLARLIFDITTRFCNRFVDKKSRANDQMVQTARSGVQNIAEGSQASGTSKKTELKLTNVVRASLEELKLDFEGFLRQRNLPIWHFSDTRRQEVVKMRFETADQFALWAKHQLENGEEISTIAANGAIVLISVIFLRINFAINCTNDLICP
jgi:four helix bundle protein